MRTVVLVPDAFGGRGGIALQGRELATALASVDGGGAEVFTLSMPIDEPRLPRGVLRFSPGSGSKVGLALRVLRRMALGPRVHCVVATHLGLLPLAALIGARFRVPIVCVLHGVECWRPPARALVRSALQRVSLFWAVSECTRDKFLEWSRFSPDRVRVLHNPIRAGGYSSGPKPGVLLDRYGFRGKRVLLSLGRMSASERYKGFDELIRAFPRLLADDPDLVLLLGGDGDDRARLVSLAAELNLSESVVFAGFIPEAEKVGHFHLADLFVMAGAGEGFGFVYLEALACGIPCVGSVLDGSRDALRGGKLGVLVDPRSEDSLVSGIQSALRRTRLGIPRGLKFFSFSRFERQVHADLVELAGGEARRT